MAGGGMGLQALLLRLVPARLGARCGCGGAAPSVATAAAPLLAGSSGGSGAAAAQPQVQQQQTRRQQHASTQPLPSPGAHALTITVRAFERRFVDLACCTISDLLLLALAPKSYGALPTGAPAPEHLPVNLSLDVQRQDVRLPWHRTRFTLIRGPHIDKKGMEQFERREYESVLSAATNSSAEVQRVLESLKIYQFPGVQIRLDVTSATAVALPTQVDAAAVRQPADAPAAGALSSSSSSSSRSFDVAIPRPLTPEEQFAAELEGVVRMLRPLVFAGLEARRSQLAQKVDFLAWLSAQRAVPTPAPAPHSAGPALAQLAADAAGVSGAAGSGGGRREALYASLLQQRLAQLQQDNAGALPPARGHRGSGAPESEASSSGRSSRSSGSAPRRVDVRPTAELLARIDLELLGAHQQALQGLEQQGRGASGSSTSTGTARWSGPPRLDGAALPAEQYAHAVLKYVQYVDALHELAGRGPGPQQRSGADDAALQLQAPGLALRLLQAWWQATSAEFKAHLGLPPSALEAAMLEPPQQQQQQPQPAPPGAATAAAAAPAGGSSSSSSKSGGGSPRAASPPAAGAAGRPRAGRAGSSGGGANEGGAKPSP